LTQIATLNLGLIFSQFCMAADVLVSSNESPFCKYFIYLLTFFEFHRCVKACKKKSNFVFHKRKIKDSIGFGWGQVHLGELSL